MEPTKTPIEQFFSQYPSETEMLYEAVPYVAFAFKKPLALFIKIQEIKEILHGFDDCDTLCACGLDEPSHNIEEMLYAMRSKAQGKTANQLDMLLNVLQMEKMYHTYTEMTKNPELRELLTAQNTKPQTTNSSNDNTQLLTQLLPLLMSGKGNEKNSPSEILALIKNLQKGDTT